MVAQVAVYVVSCHVVILKDFWYFGLKVEGSTRMRQEGEDVLKSSTSKSSNRCCVSKSGANVRARDETKLEYVLNAMPIDVSNERDIQPDTSSIVRDKDGVITIISKKHAMGGSITESSHLNTIIKMRGDETKQVVDKQLA